MIQEITDKTNRWQLLKENIFQNSFHLFEINDQYWNNSTYFQQNGNKEILSIHPYLDTSLVIAHNISKIPTLPSKFIAHIHHPAVKELLHAYTITHQGSYYKMQLLAEDFIYQNVDAPISNLSIVNFQEIQKFLEDHYPNNWFSKKQLLSNAFYSIKYNKQIIALTGIHLYQEDYSIAILGNIVVDLNYRRKGLASQLLTFQLNKLFQKVNFIGLNVNTQNIQAINCYKKLGFKIISEYEEIKAELKS